MAAAVAGRTSLLAGLSVAFLLVFFFVVTSVEIGALLELSASRLDGQAQSIGERVNVAKPIKSATKIFRNFDPHTSAEGPQSSFRAGNQRPPDRKSTRLNSSHIPLSR